MARTILPGLLNLLGIAAFAWTLQSFLRKWIKAKSVVYHLPYVLTMLFFSKDILLFVVVG